MAVLQGHGTRRTITELVAAAKRELMQRAAVRHAS